MLASLAAACQESCPGYGFDRHSLHAAQLIRDACNCPGAEVHFLVGGTQANATMLDALLSPWEGVVAAATGHVSVHEAGAIEAGGHKVIELPSEDGKLTADQVQKCALSWENDANRDHMVTPGVCYVSQPTEYGTLYSLSELEAISDACHRHGMRLYADGARLAYALASSQNDVTLPDLARMCDVFYIGGTKCGTLLGEAVVVPQAGSIPHLFAQIKQHGALLAKGMLAGSQFEAMFELEADGTCLYQRVGQTADRAADKIRGALRRRGHQLYIPGPTNQTFIVADEALLGRLDGRVEYGVWQKLADGSTVIRLATDWSTTEDEVRRLIDLL